MYTVLLIFVLLPKIFGEKITADNVRKYFLNFSAYLLFFNRYT